MSGSHQERLRLGDQGNSAEEVRIRHRKSSNMSDFERKDFCSNLDDDRHSTCLWSMDSGREKAFFPVKLSFQHTSSLVVTLRQIKYVWYPQRPSTDQTAKKQINASATLAGVSRIASINDGLSWDPSSRNEELSIVVLKIDFLFLDDSLVVVQHNQVHSFPVVLRVKRCATNSLFSSLPFQRLKISSLCRKRQSTLQA